MQDFKGRVAVITGGASGIGLNVAKALAAEGAKLVLADVEGPALDRAVQAVEAERAEAIGVLTDVRDRAAVQELAERAWKRFDAVHLVFHNAGVGVAGPVHQLGDEDWRWVIDVNLWGPINGVQAFLPRMLEQGEEGHMLFTSSFAGLVPFAGNAPYNVTKAGVVALAESLRKDLRGTRISASVLAPMLVESRIRESQRNRPSELGAPKSLVPAAERAEDTRMVSAGDAARLILDGVRRDDLFIHTHKEAEGFIRRRLDRIVESFPHAL